MNYTKTIREYCEKNKDSLFDVSYMAADYFSMVPYKTFLKIMNRLEEEGVVITVSKGVYYICGEEEFDLDKAIADYYIGMSDGMYYGYKLYNKLGVTDYKGKTIEIYTRKIGVAHKNIGNYSLTKADLCFSQDTKRIITALELIDNLDNIRDYDMLNYTLVRDKFIHHYLDHAIESVINNIHYKYSTIVIFDEALRKQGYNYKFLSNYKEMVLNK